MTDQSAPVCRRILLKLSGEALAGSRGFGISGEVLNQTVAEISEVTRQGVSVGIVVGGGNFLRGAQLDVAGIDRVTGDQMGMLATVMNGLALRDALASHQVPAEVMSAVPVGGVVLPFEKTRAVALLNAGTVVIFVAGTGNPFFTTDSAACLRGIEIDADLVLKATKVDGVYSADPLKDASARRYDRLTFGEVLAQQLGVMDLTAICLCRDHDMPVRVFDMGQAGVLKRIVSGMPEGTLIDGGKS